MNKNNKKTKTKQKQVVRIVQNLNVESIYSIMYESRGEYESTNTELGGAGSDETGAVNCSS